MNTSRNLCLLFLLVTFLVDQGSAQSIWDDPDLMGDAKGDTTEAPKDSATPEAAAPAVTTPPAQAPAIPAPPATPTVAPTDTAAPKPEVFTPTPSTQVDTPKVEAPAEAPPAPAKTPEPAAETAPEVAPEPAPVIATDSTQDTSSTQKVQATPEAPKPAPPTPAAPTEPVTPTEPSADTTKKTPPAPTVTPAQPAQPQKPVVTSPPKTPTKPKPAPVVKKAPEKINRQDILGPVKVTKVNAIDDIKGNYKSPKTALFLSLAVPGAGQYYIGGRTKTYIRGAAYTLLEAALWAGMYKVTIVDYQAKVDEYEAYADKHFSLSLYEQEILSLYEQVDSERRTDFEIRYLSGRDGYCIALYGSTGSFDCNDLNEANEHRENIPDGTLGDYDDVRNREDLYRIIGGAEFVQGWSDAEKITSLSALKLEGDQIIALGTSKKQTEYQAIRKEANDLANKQTLFLGGLILNRIVSAVDAAVTAHRHNKGLYQEELSWNQRIHIESFVHSGKTLRPGIQARLSF